MAIKIIKSVTLDNGTYAIAPSNVAAQYQWGIATGNYTSGTVVGMLEGR